MNHPDNKEWMAYLYDELDHRKAARLKDHLDSCPKCQANVRAFRKVMTELDTWKLPKEHKAGLKRNLIIPAIRRWAVAAVLLIAVGFIVGKLTASQPALYDRLLAQLQKQQQMDTANSLILLKDHLSQQFRHDLNDFAVQTLTASGMVTNQRLTELIEAIQAAQDQDRRWVAAALDQIEYNRLRDSAGLANNLQTLAVNTSNELSRTREDMAKSLVTNQQ